MGMLVKAKAAMEVAKAVRAGMPKEGSRLPALVIPTGLPAYDKMLGIGGISTKRITIVTGKPGSGKTTIVLHLCAQCQAMGGIVVWYDIEHTLTEEQADFTGCNYDDMIIKPVDDEEGVSHPEEYLEAILQDMDETIGKAEETNPDVPVIVVLDSIDATQCKGEWEATDFDEEQMMARARVWSRLLRKIVARLHRSNTALVLISQERASPNGRGNNKVSGGNGPKFYASMIMEMIPVGFLKKGEAAEPYGSEVLAKTIKNKLAPPFKEAIANLRWGFGFDVLDATMRRAVVLGISSLSGGGWYEIQTEQGELIRKQGLYGKRGLEAYFKENPQTFEYIKNEVRLKDFGPQNLIIESSQVDLKTPVAEVKKASKSANAPKRK